MEQISELGKGSTFVAAQIPGQKAFYLAADCRSSIYHRNRKQYEVLCDQVEKIGVAGNFFIGVAGHTGFGLYFKDVAAEHMAQPHIVVRKLDVQAKILHSFFEKEALCRGVDTSKSSLIYAGSFGEKTGLYHSLAGSFNEVTDSFLAIGSGAEFAYNCLANNSVHEGKVVEPMRAKSLALACIVEASRRDPCTGGGFTLLAHQYDPPRGGYGFCGHKSMYGPLAQLFCVDQQGDQNSSEERRNQVLESVTFPLHANIEQFLTGHAGRHMFWRIYPLPPAERPVAVYPGYDIYGYPLPLAPAAPALPPA